MCLLRAVVVDEKMKVIFSRKVVIKSTAFEFIVVQTVELLKSPRLYAKMMRCVYSLGVLLLDETVFSVLLP